MVAIPGIAIHNKIYESSDSLVYRGTRDDGLAIVVKLLKQNHPTPQKIIRYRQEYEITRSLDVAGVIKAYSQQNHQRTIVILLEDFGGESLEYWMRQQPDFCPMPLSAFLRLAIKITEILGRIHAANVIHKNINPGNIVLNPDTGVVKIIDFGIATRFSRTNPTFRSHTGLEGTLAYLSPEQTGRINCLLDYRTDFYSLGITFYQLLTGHLPFATADVPELVHCHIAKQPVPPHQLNATIPQPISEMILKLMAKNAEDRYQSACGIRADLERCVDQLEATGQIDPIQLGLQDVSDRFQIPQKLYGREAETKALLAAFDRVVGMEGSSHNVGMMLVSGYAGVGKSALVQELYKPITQKRGYFISGKFDQFQRNTPYSAIIDALQKLVQQLISEPDEQVQQWRSQLLAALGNNGQLIIDVIPEVKLIVGKQSPVSEVGATEARNRFNRVFGQFIRVFCSKEHPLVIFLDDLQWIDSATLQLIELMLLDEQAQSLFLIGAYRDQEVNATHPLVLTLERLREQGAVLQEISLLPLPLEPLSQLIAETLHSNVDTVRSLAQLVLRKTEGNPFFICEFLRLLYSENLLSFNAEQLSWRWNIAQIEAQNITDNVVELFLGKLKKLSAISQQMLRSAAYVGTEFSLETLSIICKKSPEAIFLDLLPAIQSGLIQPLSDLDEDLLVQEYKFLHDRVQQAAYTLIDQSQEQVVHLQMGRNLKKALSERLSERLFEIVDHLNYGLELVTDQAERDEIARLNLRAGQKAKAAIAYSAAKKYLATGRAWLAASSWQTNYDLTLELYLETTEVEYLCGDYQQVEHWAAIVLEETDSVLDIIKVYEVKIQTAIAQNQPLEATNTALQVLQQLGISFPEQPSQADIQLELDAISCLLSQTSIKDLIHLPQMNEPNKLAAMQLLSRITTVAWFAAPDLMPLLVAKQVSLSISYGNASTSPLAYANYGLVLCGKVGDIDTGYEFGQLALKLLSKPNTDALRVRTLLIVNNFIIPWKEHIRGILQPLLEGYQSGLETGDLEFAAYCAYSYCNYSYFSGKALAEVEHNITVYGERIRQMKQETVLLWSKIYHQTIVNLMGDFTHSHWLADDFYSEEDEPTQHKPVNYVISCCILLVSFNKLFFYYLFSDYSQAVGNAAIAERYVIYFSGSSVVSLYYFYSSLARLAIYPTSSTQAQEEIMEKVAISQEKMEHWAQYAPMSYLHKYHLVAAEKARVLGQVLEAEEFYEQAIFGAAENEFIQEEALAYELAAKFHLARGREKFAQTYMKEAHYCYERWGATAKVKDLETRYPQFFPQSAEATYTPIHTTSDTAIRSNITFDLAAVMKTSQAISSEIELEQLLRTLMRILIENAGAQTGFLILENSGEWAIEAAYEHNPDETDCVVRVLQSIPIADRLPPSIIQYVIRTHEPVILNDATREGNFIHRPYIQRHQPQSILCLPLLNQSKLVGVLYLENRLMTGAFTADRTQVLHLLSTQAAISIENAKLYSKLRASESQMAQFLEAVPVGIGIVDAAGCPYYVNQRGIQLLGKEINPAVTPDQFAALYQLYVAGTDQTYPTERMATVRALNGERTRNDDMEIHQSNATIPIEIWGTPIYNEQGNVAYAIAAFQDITERKQAERLLADHNHTLEQQVAERTAALQKSEAALREQEQELRLITDALPACISYVDINQRYRFVNRAYEVWFCCSRDEILGKTVREVIGEKAYLIVEPNIKQVQSGQMTVHEAEVLYPIGKKYARATLIPDFDRNAQVKGHYVLITDISDLKRAEKALQASERELQALFAAIPDPIFVMNAEGRVIKAAGISPSQLYKPLEEQLGKTVHELFAQEEADGYLARILQVLRTQQTLTTEYSLRIDGREKWFSAHIAPIRHDQVIWIARDITDRKRAEAASILEERNRMAREIHDTLAQSFAGILVRLSGANQVLTLNQALTDDVEAVRTHLDMIKELARTGLDEARRSVIALRPQLLEAGDLSSALNRLTAQLKLTTDTPLIYEIQGTAYSLPAEVENNLLRIGQEALTNAIKYAGASEIRVELVYCSAQCLLRIKDDGQGFRVDSVPLSGGFGLLGMSERAERIGAQLQIQSQPEQGTEIVVIVSRTGAV